MTRSLITIIENSLLPAVLLVAGKVFGVLISAELSGNSISINESSDAFLGYEFSVSETNLVQINSISDLFMFGAVAIYFSIIVFRALHLHNTHIDQDVAKRLFKRNLLHWVSKSYKLYHSAIAGGVFLIIANIIIWINIFNDITNIGVGILSSLISLLLIGLVVNDAYREIEEEFRTD